MEKTTSGILSGIREPYFFAHKILEDMGGKVPSFLISLDGSLILDQSY